MKDFLGSSSILLLVLLAGCGYRFVDGYPAGHFSLHTLRNATSEPELARIVEESLLTTAGIRRNGEGPLLRVILTEFSEAVESVSSGGEPVRQELSLAFQWRTNGPSGGEGAAGEGRVKRSYPWFSDPVTLDWNRNAALKLLGEAAALAISDRLEGVR